MAGIPLGAMGNFTATAATAAATVAATAVLAAVANATNTTVSSQTCPVRPSFCNAPRKVPTTIWTASYNNGPVAEASLIDLSTAQTDQDGSFREYNGVHRSCAYGFRAADCDCSKVNNKMQDWINENKFKFADSAGNEVIELSNADHGMGFKWDGLIPEGETKISFKTKLQDFWDNTLKDESCFKKEKDATWKKDAKIYGYVTAALAFIGFSIGLTNSKTGKKLEGAATVAAAGACLPCYVAGSLACNTAGRGDRRDGYFVF